MKFPNLEKHQFAILLSNSETGIVLNTDLDIYKKDEEKGVYNIFESIVEAKNFINKISLINNKIEIKIYNYKQEVAEFIEAKHPE